VQGRAHECVEDEDNARHQAEPESRAPHRPTWQQVDRAGEQDGDATHPEPQREARFTETPPLQGGDEVRRQRRAGKHEETDLDRAAG